jgi:hypothetical protein
MRLSAGSLSSMPLSSEMPRKRSGVGPLEVARAAEIGDALTIAHVIASSPRNCPRIYHRRAGHPVLFYDEPTTQMAADAGRTLSDLLRECHERAIWGALRNLWTCKEVLKYAKSPEDRERVLKAIKAQEEILDKVYRRVSLQ